MAFTVKMLSSSTTVNNLIMVNQIEVASGEAMDLYFQLVNINPTPGVCPMRYIPAAGSVVTVKIQGNGLTSQTIIKTATLAFPGDSSVYVVNLSALETASLGSVNLEVTVDDGAGNIQMGMATSGLILLPSNPYWC